MRIFGLVATLASCFAAAAIAAEPTVADLANSVFSQASFVEQCQSRKVISSTSLPDDNIRLMGVAGINVVEYWDAMSKGSNGNVYDLMNRRWVKVKLGPADCEFVLNEQRKMNNSLNRRING